MAARARKTSASRQTDRATKQKQAWLTLKVSLNTLPDSIDIRDWVYQPSLLPIASTLVNCHRVPEMARRYDEWPGEWYEGASARGAMKGWLRHGVASCALWRDEQHGSKHMPQEVVQDAMKCPGGAHYRVNHRQVRDMHATLTEVGILYASLMVTERKPRR